MRVQFLPGLPVMKYKITWTTEHGSLDVVTYVNAASEDEAKKRTYNKEGDICIRKIEEVKGGK
jgi:hypothetical protein